MLDEKYYMVKLTILEKYIDLQKYKLVSDYKNIKFEVLIFRIEYMFRITKISILKEYIGFQKYIPVSDYKNINFEGIHWFSEIDNYFGLQK